MSKVREWVQESFVGIVVSVFICAALLIGFVGGCIALGTVEFRSHNTNPKTGVVYTGGIWSSTNEKCYGTNLILDNGQGLAVVPKAEECR